MNFSSASNAQVEHFRSTWQGHLAKHRAAGDKPRAATAERMVNSATAELLRRKQAKR